MKKEFSIHLFTSLIFFLVLTLMNRWFDVSSLFLFAGAFVGTFLPDVDHLVYVYFLRPHELTSQRAQQMLSRGEVVKSLNLLATTRLERTKLVFHTLWFQMIFLALTYWVLTSSGSLFGRGLVLAFSLHLIIDQFVDLAQLGSLRNWLQGTSITFSKERATFYTIAVLLLLVFFGIAF